MTRQQRIYWVIRATSKLSKGDAYHAAMGLHGHGFGTLDVIYAALKEAQRRWL